MLVTAGDAVGNAEMSSDKLANCDSSSSIAKTFQPERLGDESLRTWMQFFGLKHSTSREFMVKRLNEVAAYLCVPSGTSSSSTAALADSALVESLPLGHEDALAPSLVAKKRGRPRKKAKPEAALPADEAACSSVRCHTDTVGKCGRAAVVDSSADMQNLLRDGSDQKSTMRSARSAAKVAELEQLAADVIRRDTELYERLLMFEPVALNEIRERLIAMDCRLQALGESRLRQFLDSQGLLFASAWRDDPKAHRRY